MYLGVSLTMYKRLLRNLPLVDLNTSYKVCLALFSRSNSAPESIRIYHSAVIGWMALTAFQSHDNLTIYFEI